MKRVPHERERERERERESNYNPFMAFALK
jgi:hypothetical protein